MKKIFFSMIAMAMTAMTFTSCEDVPMPYDLGSITKPSEESTTQLLGSGTEEDPYNVAKAMDVIKTGASSENVYVKGIVVGLGEFNATYGNYTYYINDTKTSENQLEVYRGSALGSGSKFKSESDLNIGDTVIVCGVLVNYNGTSEFTSGNYLTYLNGKAIEKEPEVGTPAGSGTANDPYNVAATIKASKALSATDTIKAVYVTGIISKIESIDTGSFGNATYYISDDGTETNQYEIYRGYYFNGDKFTAEDQIKVGQKVVVKGDLINYKGNTIEMTKGSQIISLDGKTSGTTETPTVTDGKGSTAENPLTASEADKMVRENKFDAAKEYYISGTIVSVKTAADKIPSYGNADYFISDDGTETNQIQVFRGMYLNGDKFDAESAKLLVAGKKVVVVGKLVLYTNTKDNSTIVEVDKGGKLVSIK